MKFFIVLSCLALAVMAAPDGIIKYIPVLERTEHHDDNGAFQLRYVSADGTTVNQQGILKPTLDGKDHVLIYDGDYTFTAPDGQIFRTKYVADHLGFRAEGDHLPKSVVA